MFIHRPSDRVRDAAQDHLDEPVAIVIPVSWGFGLSTPGIFAFVFGYILTGTMIGPLVSNWILALIMVLPVILILVQTRRGALGQGMIAMTSAGPGGRQAVALKAKRFSVSTPSGEVHRSYPQTTEIQLLDDRRWWQGTKCRVGEDIYFVNPNFDDEVGRALDTVST